MNAEDTMKEFEELLISNAQELGKTIEASVSVNRQSPNGNASAAEREASRCASPPTPLWQRKQPQYIRQQELAWHRIALEMAANGYTAIEIAARLECSAVAVQDILKQPQYQQTQVDLIRREANQDHEVCKIIKANVAKAVNALADIVTDKNARNTDRISAARELLDRRYGKANQPMNRGTDVDLNNLSDAELAKMLPASTATGTNA